MKMEYYVVFMTMLLVNTCSHSKSVSYTPDYINNKMLSADYVLKVNVESGNSLSNFYIYDLKIDNTLINNSTIELDKVKNVKLVTFNKLKIGTNYLIFADRIPKSDYNKYFINSEKTTLLQDFRSINIAIEYAPSFYESSSLVIDSILIPNLSLDFKKIKHEYCEKDEKKCEIKLTKTLLYETELINYIKGLNQEKAN